jgi:hypothetical protein
MAKPKLEPIDIDALDEVTGGSTGNQAVSRLDGLISELNSITSACKDIEKKTKGFDDSQMMLLMFLALQDRPRRRW